MTAAAAPRIDVPLEAVDSNGLLPLHATERVFQTAFAFRRYLQANLRPHLEAFPAKDPLRRVTLPRLAGLPQAILKRWPIASAELLGPGHPGLSALAIDHRIAPAAHTPGGSRAAARAFRRFVSARLATYDEDRNHPDRDATSGLSAYLHFGHLAAHDVFHAVAAHEGWAVERLRGSNAGKRSGWWRMRPSAEAFLEQLVTWRELGLNFATQRSDIMRYASLPAWAQVTLATHVSDPRPVGYSLDQLENAQTHDALWNAAQRQLVREGRMHNYLRMLWGKKILQWAEAPEAAVEIMITLNDQYALDGRDPNSYSGIFWCLGRYDRPWGPERPIFGTVRYMSSTNTARKVRTREYLSRYSE
jgi:deoxyribodipyrimidine photo-lyase